MSGKLDVGDPRAWWAFALDRLTSRNLALRPEHVAEIHIPSRRFIEIPSTVR